MFIHLRVHTAYSLAEGAIHIKSLAPLCAQNKMPALGITDTANLFGALEIAMALSAEGIQPIIGCELPFEYDPQKKPAPLCVLAQSEEGFHNLLKLVSFMYGRDNSKPHIYLNLEEISQLAPGLIAFTGGDIGPLGKLLLEDQEDKAKELLKSLKWAFPDSLYMEIMRHGTENQTKTEPSFINWAQEESIPLIATNNVFFSEPAMYEAHDALLCVAEGSYISEDKRRRETPQHYFKSPKEMAELFKDIPEAISNTLVVARRCYFMPTARDPILPPFKTISGLSEKEELRRLAYEGLEKRITEEVLPIADLANNAHKEAEIRQLYSDRLEYELDIIEKMGFPGYFLIVADFIQWAKSQGIPVGPGRGSGAGSLVAWSTTITDIDPIRFSLIFERFLNPERVSMPDFDVDFCQDRRDEVIAYVCEKYGKDKVAHIITFGKLQARAVIRDVGRVLQMPYGQVDKISKLIPNNPANPVTLAQALELEPELKRQREEDETVSKLIDIALQLEGLYRHASTHAAGVVIGDRPLSELVPLYVDERSALPVTQYNMKYAEAAGLMKFDFLGLKTLTVIEKACDLIRKTHAPDFKIQHIPLDDPKTFEMLGRVETVGVFQLESAGMKDVLRKLQPDRFEDLVALVALYRPGPMDDIPRYLNCKHGLEEVSYLHPALEPILAPTYGVMVYQEQVMQIAQVLGGYTLGAADLLRRAMGKKIKSEMDAQRALFTEGAIKNGVKEDIATLIFEQMAKFAGYGFNKSHSAPYALLAYQTAYLKANYPAEFFAATMTLDMHNTDKINIYLQDMKTLGLELLPPDVNTSMAHFTVEGKNIRYGLGAIKNVGAQAMESLCEERIKQGSFKDLKDFFSRMDSKQINKRQLENLIYAGALDSLHPNRAELIKNMEMILSFAAGAQSTKTSKQNLLFGSSDEGVSIPFNLSPEKQWGSLESLQHEFNALGFYLRSHPLDLYKNVLAQMEVIHSANIGEHLESGKNNLLLAGIVMAKQVRVSKKGQKFAFVTLSDSWGTFEVTLFSEVYTASMNMLEAGTPLLVTATGRMEGEEIRITAQSLQNLAEQIQGREVIVSLPLSMDVKPVVDYIKRLSPGDCRISLTFSVDGNGAGVSGIRVNLKDRYTLDIEQKEKLRKMSECGF